MHQADALLNQLQKELPANLCRIIQATGMHGTSDGNNAQAAAAAAALQVQCCKKHVYVWLPAAKAITDVTCVQVVSQTSCMTGISLAVKSFVCKDEGDITHSSVNAEPLTVKAARAVHGAPGALQQRQSGAAPAAPLPAQQGCQQSRNSGPLNAGIDAKAATRAAPH